MNKYKIQRGITMILCVSAVVTCSAQVPLDYVTKVSYHEKTEVSYAMVGEEDKQCLTLAELSEYHYYMQFYTMDEYVDMEGDLLTDKQFIEEQDIRDDWMAGLGRITVGKHHTEVYDNEGNLMVSKEREPEDDPSFLNHEQQLMYGTLHLDEIYIQQISTELQEMGFDVQEEENLLIARSDEHVFMYDDVSKIASTVSYDSKGVKIQETITQFEMAEESETYFPATETTIEWFLGENGCCIRKTTVVSKYNYLVETGEEYSAERKEVTDRYDSDDLKEQDDFKILTDQESAGFRIDSKKYNNKPLDITIYDMAGKTILNKKVQEGELIKLPQTSRAGVYVVHIRTKNASKPSVGKVIKTAAGVQF